MYILRFTTPTPMSAETKKATQKEHDKAKENRKPETYRARQRGRLEEKTGQIGVLFVDENEIVEKGMQAPTRNFLSLSLNGTSFSATSFSRFTTLVRFIDCLQLFSLSPSLSLSIDRSSLTWVPWQLCSMTVHELSKYCTCRCRLNCTSVS